MAQKIMGFLQTKKQYFQIASLAAVSAVLCLSLIVFLNNSFGWFSKNNTVKATEFTVAVSDDTGVVADGFTVYKYLYDRNKYEHTFYSGDNAVLNEYDTVFTSRNEKNAVIIKIDISKYKAGGKFSLKFTCGDGTAEQDTVSDMVKFRAAPLVLDGSEEEIYNAAVSELKNSEKYSDYTFFSESGGNITEKRTEFTTQQLSFESGCSIYILMDYYPGVIESKDIAFDGKGETTEYPGDAFDIEIIEE